MLRPRSRAARLGGIVLGCCCLGPGCGGGEEEKPVGEPVTLSPGMEQMKKEMIASFQKTAAGKRVLKVGESPPLTPAPLATTRGPRAGWPRTEG